MEAIARLFNEKIDDLYKTIEYLREVNTELTKEKFARENKIAELEARIAELEGDYLGNEDKGDNF